jgi:ADP-ribose pyrophosphatase YjhB (NUDIX family)
MKKVFFTYANKIRKIYWKITKPITIGVRAIILNSKNEILLVRTHYSNQWFLPGGDVKKLEMPETAIKREVQEECNIELNTSKIVGVYSNFYESKSDHIVLFYSENVSTTPKSAFEVAETNFFNLNSLPSSISPGTKRRVDELKNNLFNCGKW